MDSVAGLLDGPRARGAFLVRSSMNPPWSLRVRDQAPLTIAAMVRGSAWVLYDDEEPIPLAAGDDGVGVGGGGVGCLSSSSSRC